MNVVLLTTSRTLSPSSLGEIRHVMGAEDVPLGVIAWRPPTEPIPGVVVVGPPAGRSTAPAALPVRLVRRAVRGGLSRRFHRQVRRDPRARRLLDGAELVVVLDTAGIRAGWWAARRWPNVQAVYGAGAAARLLRG